ncbi:MAG: hypothetical protein ACT4OK_09035 [Gemmobacter sp.]
MRLAASAAGTGASLPLAAFAGHRGASCEGGDLAPAGLSDLGQAVSRAMAAPSPMPGMEVRFSPLRRVVARASNSALRASVRVSI